MKQLSEFDKNIMTWSDVRALLREYRVIIAAVALSGIFATYGCLQLFFTEMYEAKAGILVKVGRENAETPPSVQNGQMLVQGVPSTDVNSEVQMLSSRALIEDVVDKLGPEAFQSKLVKPDSVFGYPKFAIKWVVRQVKPVYKEALISLGLKKRLSLREEAIEAASAGVTAEPVKESDTLQLKVRLPSPQLAVRFSDALLDFYLNRRVQTRASEAGVGFFANQLQDNRSRMEHAEQMRDDVRAKWGVSSATEQRTLSLKRLSEIQSEIALNEAEIARMKEQTSAMASMLKTLPPLVQREQVTSPNPSIQSIKDRLAALQVERAQISARYQAGAAPLTAVEDEIATLEKVLTQQQPTIVAEDKAEANPAAWDFSQQVESQQVKIAGLRARNQQLQVAANEVQQELARIDHGSDAYDDAEREYRLAEFNYLTYSKKQEETRISRELDEQHIANVAVFARPAASLEPVSPRKLFIMEIAIPLWLALGILFAALLESMDDRIRSGRDLAGMDGMDWLGSVPVPRTVVSEPASSQL